MTKLSLPQPAGCQISPVWGVCLVFHQRSALQTVTYRQFLHNLSTKHSLAQKGYFLAQQ